MDACGTRGGGGGISEGRVGTAGAEAEREREDRSGGEAVGGEDAVGEDDIESVAERGDASPIDHDGKRRVRRGKAQSREGR